MSWHYSQALVAEYLEDTCSDGGRSAPSRTTLTASAYCCDDRMTAFLSLSQSGMTFEPLTVTFGRDVLAWFLEVFPVRTSALPAEERASMERIQVCGSRCSGSRKKSSRDTCLSKIHRCSGREAWRSYCKGLPMWGSMHDGVCFRLAPLVRHTCESDCSFWPTPTASMATRGWTMLGRPGKGRYRRETLENCAGIGCRLPVSMQESIIGWPIGWTDLELLGTARFRQWLSWHGIR